MSIFYVLGSSIGLLILTFIWHQRTCPCQQGFLPKARGKYLTRLGIEHCVARRLFEPDWMLRRRIVKLRRSWWRNG